MHRSLFAHFTGEETIALKTSLWLASMLLIFLAAGGDVTNRLSSLDYASLKQNGFYLWVVLFLCIAWVFIKRSDIIRAINDADTHVRWLFFGILLLVTSVPLLYHIAASPSELAVGLFAAFYAVVATFTVFFGRASKIPLMLLGLFGVAVFFPMVLESAFSAPFSRITAILSVSTLQLLGVPITLSGVTVTLSSMMGYDILTKVDARCAGSDSLAIFFAIFGLMLIDRRPRSNALVGLLILGVVGTYFQNFVRLLLLFAAGYFYGSGALWTVHDYAGYILFPFWFLIFAVVYLRYAERPPTPSKKRITSTEQITKL
ncbi:MAG: archaeosortase/exosortase family protein [Halobacteriota archaeon]